MRTGAAVTVCSPRTRRQERCRVRVVELARVRATQGGTDDMMMSSINTNARRVGDGDRQQPHGDGGRPARVKTFEEGFAETQRAAESTTRAAATVVTLAKQLRKAARLGDIAAIRRLSERMVAASDAAREEVGNARTSWPFSPDEEEAYVRDVAAQKTAALRMSLKAADEDRMPFVGETG